MALSKVNPNFLNVSQVGGRRNLVINGDHQVQQRGTTFATSGSDRFASDRWALNPIGGSPCSASIQFDSTLQKNTLKVTKETSTGDIQIIQKIEGFKQFHNKQYTLSYYVRASTSRNLYIGSGFSSASGFTSIDTTTVPATTQWQRFTRTFSSTDLSGYTENNSSWLRLEFRLSGASNGSVAAGEWIEFTDVQLELGDQDTPFEHRSYGEELSLCQRYYQIWGAKGSNYHAMPMWIYGTVQASTSIDLPKDMRTSPTITRVGNIGNSSGESVGTSTWAMYYAGAWVGCNAFSTSEISPTSFRLDADSFNNMSSGGACGMYGGTDCYLTLEAEL